MGSILVKLKLYKSRSSATRNFFFRAKIDKLMKTEGCVAARRGLHDRVPW